jgi:hypothetical protein
MSAALPATLSVSNTKLAASLWALGFAWTADRVQPESGGPLHVQFIFHGASARFPALQLSDAHAWESGRLAAAHPLHPLCVMMHAQHNYDRLMDWQKRGTSMALQGVAGQQLCIYKLAPVPHFEGPFLWSEDLALCAAVALAGVPVVGIQGSEGMHRYRLPASGYALRSAAGVPLPPVAAAALMQRDPVPTDPLRLALEVSEPLHPVCLAYDALHARACLKKQLESGLPLLLMQQSGSQRQALITMNSTGRVMERVNQHFKAPPMRWA